MVRGGATQEEVKNTLRVYSKFLRRDFLAILVKMSARHLEIRTVRSDWRTRKGMIHFLQRAWAKFSPLLSQDTIFNWYSKNFDTLEKIFSQRKFILFLYSSWDKYGEFLKTDAALAFLKSHQSEVETIITTGSSRRSRAWQETDTGRQMSKIIEEYFMEPKEAEPETVDQNENITSEPEIVAPLPETITQSPTQPVAISTAEKQTNDLLKFSNGIFDDQITKFLFEPMGLGFDDSFFVDGFHL